MEFLSSDERRAVRLGRRQRLTEQNPEHWRGLLGRANEEIGRLNDCIDAQEAELTRLRRENENLRERLTHSILAEENARLRRVVEATRKYVCPAETCTEEDRAVCADIELCDAVAALDEPTIPLDEVKRRLGLEGEG